MSDTSTRPGAAPEEPPPTPQPTSKGPLEDLDPKLGGLLAYLLFGWVGGLIMLFTQKHPEVRFHGAQSVLLSIGLAVIYAVVGVFSSVLTIGFGSWALFSALYSLMGLASFGLWVLMCIKGYNLEHFKLPVIGDYAERWVAKA
jgi:uncharacterized membrane protein